jgi:hypothetical protein
MRIRLLFLSVAALLAACGDAPSAPTAAASTFSARVASFDELPEERWNVRFDLRGTEFAPCWGDEGELVTFDGAIHFMYSVQRDAMGRTVLRQHSNPQGLKGRGWDSGLQYVANGTFRSREWYLPNGELPQDFTFSDRWRYLAQGSARDFDRVVTIRLTMNEVGELIPIRERESIECR